MQSTNLSEINDIEKLKAMAFDQISVRDIASSNLQNIIARLQQLGAPASEEPADGTVAPLAQPDTPEQPQPAETPAAQPTEA